ncbi:MULTISPECIES: permease [Franconibacter]|uniref:permease n=1 Tax=Franconibacter TaxID=1649295 RepID=UPI001FFBB8B2|nr:MULTISPECIES: permease [Franconibacter]MCK1968782.1 permease [Franconibacter sp. IITDAS19]MEB5921868.1 permease [Franconibacter daqui]
MAGQSSSLALKPHALWKPALFFLVLIVGLWYVKWQPYYGKAFTAAQTHSIGKSLLAQPETNPLRAALDYAMVYFLAVWKAAVLGVLLGSLIQVLIPRDWLMRTLGQVRFRGTLIGTLFSLPGMMCTCCAAPVAAGMRRQSVSIGGALAFWLGNPLLNPATLVFMGFVLGWHFALVRLLAGLVMVPGVAWLVQRWVKDDGAPTLTLPESQPQPQGAFLARWGKALWTLFWNTIPVYVLAVLALGAARVWLFPHVDGDVGNTLMWVIAMAIVGCLFVIPTAAEIPIVQTMMLAGMGVAPALALLMTLPAVSLPSLIMLRKAFPTKALWLTGALVMCSGVIVGTLALL